MKDDLGIFGGRHERDDGSSEHVDVTELREVLARQPVAGSAAATSASASTRRAARAQQRAELEAVRRRKRRRRRSTLIAVLVLAILAGGMYVGFRIWQNHRNEVVDFTGAGDSEVIVRIRANDSLDDIARTLAEHQVVADSGLFAETTAGDADVRAVQPGYYKLRTHASVAAAADALVDPANRVGRVDLIPGRQLADVSANAKGKTTVVPGYISEIAEAACVPVNGATDCVTPDELWKVAETALPSDLGVVDWALDDVSNAPDRSKRLEGMILPGPYNVPPNAGALETLREVISASTAKWNQTEIVADAATAGVTPYEMATIASIVEKEGLTKDMPKVARVIYNRLDIGMKLQMDSTVNYALDRAQISTSSEDRKNPSPYNTYMHTGLTPTPITSPGSAALAAAAEPAAGGWKFFVKVDLDGNSCFSVTDEEHAACVEKARENGVFD